MSDWDDLDDVTPRISNDDVERLLSGTPGIDESPRLADLSSILHALRGPAEPAELAGLNSALEAFKAAVVTTQPNPPMARTRPMRKKLLTGKTLAAVGALTFVSAGAVAAAGVVPTPFSASRPSPTMSTERVDDDSTEESAAAETLDTTIATDESQVTAPTDQDAAQSAASPTEDTGVGQGPDVNGPAKFGLCTAFEARTKHDDTTSTTEAGATPPAEPAADSELPPPFQSLTDAADAAGQTVADFCADAVPGGLGDSPGQSGDNPSATAPGRADDNPSATAPGKSDDNPSATAPSGPPETHGKSGGDHGKPPNTHP